MLFVAASLIFLPQAASAKDTPSILINEVAWMGNAASHTNEWIELFNTTDHPILLNGWSIALPSGTLTIRLRGEISSKTFFLLERTDDNSIPAIKADLIYKGSLPNNGGELILYDAEKNVVDQIPAPWPGGNNATKQTMERTPFLEWQTSASPDGTPKKENSPGQRIVLSNPSLPNELKSDNTNVTATDAIGSASLFPANLTLQHPWWLFGAALTVTLIAGAAFLILKIRKRL